MKNKITILVALAILLASLSFNNVEAASKPSGKKAKNIIFIIGDGMGVAHLNAAMSVSKEKFWMELFPYAGLVKTFSADNYITDSAASGTAMASGVKTNNGMIGVAPDSTILESIIAVAHRNGLATGVVSTSSVTHATPASYVAHNAGRGNYEDIAKDFLNGTLDLFLGGGEDHFRKREDSLDLTLELKKQGFNVVYTVEDMKNDKSNKLAGLLAKEHLPQMLEGRGDILPEMTAKAIEVLSKDKDGFFLMVEASMIDWGGHDKNLDYVIAETIDLDKAVGVALNFAKANGETLVIVTADHETGGLTLPGGKLEEKTVRGAFSTTNHTAVMVPLFAFGPGAEMYSGINDNTFYFNNFMQQLRLKK